MALLSNYPVVCLNFSRVTLMPCMGSSDPSTMQRCFINKLCKLSPYSLRSKKFIATKVNVFLLIISVMVHHELSLSIAKVAVSSLQN